MATKVIPIGRFLFGNEHWRSYRAIDEVEVYCELLEDLQGKIDSLEIRGKNEVVTLINIQAVLSSYAFEIALKSLWALDNPTKGVPHTHNLSTIFRELKEETVKSLVRLQFSGETLVGAPTPFLSNRYSMESCSRDITVYQTPFLRSVVQLLKERLEETKAQSFDHLIWPTTDS